MSFVRPANLYLDEISNVNPSAVTVQPYNLVETKTSVVTSFIPEVISLEFNKSVTVLVTMYNAQNSPVGNKTLVIDGAEYQAWLNDDNYLINLVASKIGMTKA